MSSFSKGLVSTRMERRFLASSMTRSEWFSRGRICHSLCLSFCFSPSTQGQLPASYQMLYVSPARLCFILRILTSTRTYCRPSAPLVTPNKDTHVVSAMIGHLEKDARLREQKDNRPLSHQFRRPRLTERYLQKVEATEKIAFSAISCKSRSDTEILIIHCPFLQKA